MKRFLLLTLIFVFALTIAVLCTGCVVKTVKGELVTETCSLEGADSFVLKDLSMKVSGEGIGPTVEFVTDGGAPSATISMQEGMFDTVKLQQNGRNLVFSGKKRYIYLTDYEVKIVVKNCVFTSIGLHNATQAVIDDASLGENLSLDLSGASSLSAKNAVCGTFTLEGSGASRVTFDAVTCTKLNADLSGASTFTATVLNVATDFTAEGSGASRYSFTEGTAPTLHLDLSGASTFDALNIVTNIVESDESGASTVKITCNGTISGKASGGSSLEYRGTASTDVDLSGGSTVKKV